NENHRMTLDPNVLDWFNLALRWGHVITGIAWIGASFYFMWLDSHLEKPDPPRKGVEGELWMVHSGGFYVVEKIHVAPEALPTTLHWFKWEAGFTWITGFLLLIVVYYLGSESYLIDPEVLDIDRPTGIAIGIGSLVVAWAIYDFLYVSPLAQKGVVSPLIGIALLCIGAWGLTKLLSAHAAYMHVGAMIGTVMVANVWMRIIPAQRALVNARKTGAEPDPTLGKRAKQRSVHNNYLTLPVVFVMLSGHYPATYGHEHSWAVLLALFAVGALVRHWFNLRNAGKSDWWPVPASVAMFLALMYIVMPPVSMSGSAATDMPAVAFADVQDIVAKRCVMCHADRPANPAFDAAPKNVKLETPEQIRRFRDRIWSSAVASNAMPLGNATGMTPEERETVEAWIRQGAKIN
ncbi:MAG: urate hydroxylase PuuD, partial [Rhodospirillales bacterium]